MPIKGTVKLIRPYLLVTRELATRDEVIKNVSLDSI